MKFFRKLNLLLFSLLLGQLGREGIFAQSYNFKNYSAEQGLPSLKVDVIYQDSKGYLWVGGYGGLSRFNGKQFIANYSHKDGLANQYVTSIVEDNKGNLWAGTASGLSKFNGSTFTTFKRRDGLAGDYINSITKDSNGNLWIGTSGGVTFYDGKSFKLLPAKNELASSKESRVYAGKSGTIWMITDRGLSKIISEKNILQDKLFDSYRFVNCHFAEAGFNISSVIEDDSGNTWFGTDSGVVRFDGIKFITYTTRDGLLSNDIKSVAKGGSSNDIWVGTSQGLNKISGNGRIETFKVSNVQQGNNIINLLTDAEGNLWLGTGNGMYRFRDPSFYTFSVQDRFKDSQIQFIFRDSKKNLWVGTVNEGVHMYSSFGALKTFSAKDGLLGTITNAFMEDKSGNIWIGTSKGVFIYGGKTFIQFHEKKNDEVTAIMQDRKGRVWLGADKTITILNKDKITTCELKSDDPKTKLFCAFEDSKGNIWLGTRSGELFLYPATENNEVVQEKNFVNFSRKLNLKSKTYFAITEDKDGILYFGSFEGGVYLYDPSGKKILSNGHILHIGEKEGLSSDMVYVMSFDANEENLYIGTNQGLNKLDIKEFKKSGKINVRQYGTENGLGSLDFNPNGIWRDDDGTFWLGMTNGLFCFNPRSYYENHVESNTSIQKISLLYKDTILPPNSELAYDQNNIAFQYIGICLTNPEKVRYRYKLEGYSKDWSPETEEVIARYSNLSPQKYVFKVMSCNNEGIWNKTPVSFSFEILPPIWKKWWFKIVISVIVIVIIVVFSKLRADAIRREEAEKLNREIQLANNELKALRAQMDPHFIFNSLSSIQSFIMTNDDESALRYLNKFAKLMRRILANSEKASVTIDEELELLELYLELEALRWDNKFDYAISIDPEIEADFHKIPSMLIQPYVENAILHGVVPKTQRQGMIEIRISQNETHIICTVSDNGVGRKKSQEFKQTSYQTEHESMGMKITSDRLEVLNRMHHSDLNVKITDMKNIDGTSAGTKVEIFIPIS